MAIIMHLDLDAFFASCEEALNLSLKNKPLVIGADPKGGTGRGVVSTCNYAARKFGIHSAMPISWAYKRCPQATFLTGDFSLYSKVSKSVFEIISSLLPLNEKAGIDEAYADASHITFLQASSLSRKIQHLVLEKEKITISIGIGPNKLIAKIASDYKKPNGVTIVKPNEVQSFLNPLPVRKLLGVGKKTNEKLEKLKILTIEDLSNFPESRLVSRFGNKWGPYLKRKARGEGSTSIGNYRERKSIGKERTFFEDTEDTTKVKEKIDDLIERTFLLTKERSLKFKTVTIKIRYLGFETHTCQKSKNGTIQNMREAKYISHSLLKPYLSKNKKIRLVGIRFSNFINSQF